jgi:hypothetical protein
MAKFEIDRLFGLALTDARFFRLLRERPHQAIVQFDLTDSETQAVLHIAPEIGSIQEFAMRLDSWMTSNAGAVCYEPAPNPALALHRLSLLDLDRHPEERPYTHTPDTIQEKERGICLTLNEYVAQS